MADDTRPTLRVVRGDPDDAEVAALLAVTSSLGRATPDEETAPARSAWADRAALLRLPPRPGPGAWRASALPR